MTSGVYVRKKKEQESELGGVAEHPRRQLSGDEASRLIIGRYAHRIMLHTGVSIGIPPRSRVVTSIMADYAPYPKPTNAVLATAIIITPLGAYVRFADNTETLVFASDIYNADLE